jgi:hypothetical protein
MMVKLSGGPLGGTAVDFADGVELQSFNDDGLLCEYRHTGQEEVAFYESSTGHDGEAALVAEQVRIAALVDAETRRRIALGYAITDVTRKSPVVPVTLRFSLSVQAQLNLAGFDVRLIDAWPVQWDCADDTDALILKDEAAMAQFILVGKGTIAYRVSTGRYVRRAVMDSTSIDEAEAAAVDYLQGKDP